MSLISINPYTREPIAEYSYMKWHEVLERLQLQNKAFKIWRHTPLEIRKQSFSKLAGILEDQKITHARNISLEMGKLLKESIQEIDKCITICNYVCDEMGKFLEDQVVLSDASKSYLRFEPLGSIYGIMPWNFPYWQVFRFALPVMLAGNAVLLKHAPNVTGCALAIEKLMQEAGFPDYLFQSLRIDISQSDQLIAHTLVKGVSLTASVEAGKAVAALAGKHIKKTVLELGGADPLIIFKDADINKSCQAAWNARHANCGQVCIAAKRFIVEDGVYAHFIQEQKTLMKEMKPGDPLHPDTTLAPMARPDLTDQIDRQVQRSIQMGAKLIFGGRRWEANKAFYLPTLLAGVHQNMPVYREETFGPVGVVVPFHDEDEAIRLANDTDFGLGCSIWTQDLTKALRVSHAIETGNVFVNGLVKSDPRLPFGGVKNSGYGRELGSFGVREFTNIKTIWIK